MTVVIRTAVTMGLAVLMYGTGKVHLTYFVTLPRAILATIGAIGMVLGSSWARLKPLLELIWAILEPSGRF